MTAPHRLPCRVWPTAGVPPSIVRQLQTEMVEDALIEPGGGAVGPAVVLLCAHEVVTAGQQLRTMLRLAAPMRPVLLGGTGDRAVLAAAINHLGVVRVVSEAAPPRALRAALLEAHELGELDDALRLNADALAAETSRLEVSVESLDVAKRAVVAAERLATLGRLTSAITTSVRAHRLSLDAFLTGLRAEITDEDLLRVAELAQGAATSIARLLDELDAYARGGGIEHNPALCRVADVVDEVVAFARYDELAQRKTLTVERNDGGATAALDRVAIYHAVLNLIRNALDATPPSGRVEVRSEVTPTDVVIEVEDNGTGMPKAVREKLFTPFFSTKGRGGIGLGMAICRAVADRHGGRVEVESEVGRGTRVRLVLPREA